MYGHNTTINNTFSDASAHFFGHFASLLPHVTAPPSAQVILPTPPPLVIPGNELDSMWALKSEVGYSSSGCSSYGSPSSLGSYSSTQGSSLIQRSVSSHSLIQKNGFCGQLVSSPIEFVDSETSPVRRVFSTGDLQERINMVQQYRRSESPLSNESIIESMNKACRYSPEEKKERIERYRSKRNQRNFNKKIKYACRKTLADSRPRIRGRFARNDEIEKSCPNQWSQVSGEEEEEDDDNWVNFLETFSANLIP